MRGLAAVLRGVREPSLQAVLAVETIPQREVVVLHIPIPATPCNVAATHILAEGILLQGGGPHVVLLEAGTIGLHLSVCGRYASHYGAPDALFPLLVAAVHGGIRSQFLDAPVLGGLGRRGVTIALRLLLQRRLNLVAGGEGAGHLFGTCRSLQRRIDAIVVAV